MGKTWNEPFHFSLMKKGKKFNNKVLLLYRGYFSGLGR